MSTITDCPAGHLSLEAVDAVLRAAVLAPSSHNTQWFKTARPAADAIGAELTRLSSVKALHDPSSLHRDDHRRRH